MNDRRRMVAIALREMADRVESGNPLSYRMESMVDVMYPRITILEGGPAEIADNPIGFWSGVVAVELPDGTLDDLDLQSYGE